MQRKVEIVDYLIVALSVASLFGIIFSFSLKLAIGRNRKSHSKLRMQIIVGHNASRLHITNIIHKQD